MSLPQVEHALHFANSCLEIVFENAFGSGGRAFALRCIGAIRAIVHAASKNRSKIPDVVVFFDGPIADWELPEPAGGVGAVIVDGFDEKVPKALPCNPGTVDLWAANTSGAPGSSRSVMFVRSAAGQSFYIKGKHVPVSPLYEPCLYALGTHFDVSEALRQYATDVAAHSYCGYLKSAWKEAHNHLLVPEPEARLRDSLWRYLFDNLRGYTVEREFTVGASKPVDLYVVRNLTQHRGFIEVKWLGKSETKNSTIHSHGPARAQQGAEQLRDHYVDPYLKEHPDADLLGYLATFDARKNRKDAVDFSKELKDDVRLRLDHVLAMDPS